MPTATSVNSLIKRFPRAHIALASILGLSLAVISALPSSVAQASRKSIELPLPELVDSTVEIQPIEDAAPTSESSLTPLPAVDRVTETVKSGDNLSIIFARAGLTDKDLLEFVNSSKEAKSLVNLYPGHKLIFEVSAGKTLMSVRHEVDKLNAEVFIRANDQFLYEKIVRTPDVKIAVRSGTITSSLYNAGINAGLDEQLIMELAGIFGWDVDFALDIRKGDSFRLVYEEKFLEGEPLGSGNILAAEFINQNSAFQAVRYTDEHGNTQYYSPTGKAMQKAFLRAPLDFRRISSNFNPRRLHPITKTVRPHRGTDYAANRGTPVWASGDGKVLASGYTSTNGNYIVIQHGGEIQTKYLHLEKRLVRKGDRVKQKQIIGKVGTTGLSTAPHLHYEFLVNGVHRNPRTIIQKLPKANSIPSNEMQRFINKTQPLVAHLEQSTRMAALPKDTSNL